MRTEEWGDRVVGRPFGTYANWDRYPALKRWAIIGRPFGTGEGRSRGFSANLGFPNLLMFAVAKGGQIENCDGSGKF
jgi:hypothetical protein